MMDIQSFINQQLSFPTYALGDEEARNIAKSGIVPYLTKKLLSNRYRKSTPSPDVAASITRNIQQSVKEEKPIHLTIPLGGYKKWQLGSAPTTDWSEFFHLRYMLEYMAPVAAAYKPGVLLDYFSNGWMAKVISFYSDEDLAAYTKSFRELIDQFAGNFPPNVQISYNVVAEQKDERMLLERTLKNRPVVEAAWQKLSDEEKREKLAYSERSIRWDRLERDRPLTADEKEKLIYEGKIIHDSLLMGGWNGDLYYLRSENGIGIIHRNSDPYFLHLATVAGSFVQFWVGTGILEERKGRDIPRVLSYTQYMKVKNELERKDISGVQGKNFPTIEVLRG